MAEGFLKEVTTVISKNAGKGAGELGQAGKAAGEVSKASKAIEEVIIQGASKDAEIAVNGEAAESGVKVEGEIKEGMEKSQNEVKDVVEKLEKGEPGAAKEAEALEGTWKDKFKNVWVGAKTFGSFVAVEVLKGALFCAGMKGIEVAWEKLFPAHQASGPGSAQVDDDRVRIIKAINKAGDIIQKALDSWSKWQAGHFDKRDSYGSVTVGGITIQLFQVLQNGIAEAGEKRDKMVPLMTKANSEKTLVSAKAILAADIEYAKSVVDLAAQIQSKMTAMTDAGLPNKYAEVQAAYSMLVAASA